MISLFYKIINVFIKSKKHSNIREYKIDGINYKLLPDDKYITIKSQYEEDYLILRIKDIKDFIKLKKIMTKIMEEFEKENKKKKIKIILGN